MKKQQKEKIEAPKKKDFDKLIVWKEDKGFDATNC
jgi:hypothetical protein